MSGPSDIKSRFVLKFEQEGAEKVQKQVDRLQQSMQGAGVLGVSGSAKGGDQGRLMKQVAGMSRHIHEASKSLIGLNRAVAQVDKALSRLAASMGGGGAGGGGAGGGTAGGSGAFGRAGRAAPAAAPSPDLAAGSFAQGALQGVGFGPYLQRGPGMLRQAAGVMVGGGARRVGGRVARMGRAALSMPFRGTAGLVEGLASIPGGGLLTGALQSGLGAARDAIADEEAWTSLGGSPAWDSNIKTKADRARARVMARSVNVGAAASSRFQAARETYKQAHGTWPSSSWDISMGKVISSDADASRKAAIKDRATRASAAADKIRSTAFGGFRADTKAYSLMDRTQAARFAGQLGVSTLDGSFGAAERSGQLRQAMQLNTLGVGPEATAGFIRGARQGGLSGNKDMTKVWSEAIKAGFDRSEVTALMGQITQGQQQFLSSGIPINQDSLVRMSGAVAGVLGPGGRSASFAGQLQAGMKNLADAGPQNTSDMAALRHFGGFRGGGAAGLWEAEKRLEGGNFTKSQLEGYIRSHGSSAVDRRRLQAGLKKLGVRLSHQEIDRMVNAVQAGGLESATADKMLARMQGREGLEDAGGAAKRLVGSSSGQRGRRDIQDQRTVIGKSLVGVAQSLERSSNNVAGVFAELSPTLKRVTGMSEAVSKTLPDIARNLQTLIDKLMTMAGVVSPGAD